MMLNVAGLTVRLGGRDVLNDFDLDLAEGDRVGLVGESGSGKTMAALAMMGLSPDAARVTGSVRLDNRDLIGLPERQRARVRGAEIGMVFQEPLTALNPIRTVGRQIAEPLRIHTGASRTETRRQALKLARLVALPDPEETLSRYPHQLSGGQRQRIGIAAALAAEPRILIADEPTTALDVTIQAEILSLFDRIVDELGTALVFITHDLAVLRQVAEHAIVLSEGRVVGRQSVTALLKAPEHPTTRRLVEAARATSWSPCDGEDADD